MIDIPTPASVRRKLIEQFEALPLFRRNRDTALYHFCAALELIPAPVSDSPDLAMAKGRHAIEASMQAIPAIFRLCPATPVSTSLEINLAALAEASELVEFASRLDQIMYCFDLTDREQQAVRYDPLTQSTVFSYTSPDESAADTLLRTHERDSRILKASPADHAISLELAQQVKDILNRTIVFSSPDAINYIWTAALLDVARKHTDLLARAMPWDFPEDLSVGNLTFRDIRRFWGVLLTIALIHDGAHIMASQGRTENIPRGSILLLKHRTEWTELIADVGGIAVGAVSELLWWYTYDPMVAEAAGPIQPFLEVVRDYLALPLSLVTTHSVERNLQKILSRHPNLRSLYPEVKSAKERIALTHLRTLFSEEQFAVESNILIKGVTDADLVVCERNSGFVLVIQHKWLIAPETVTESGANDDELRKGVTQAIQSRDVFRKDHALVRRELGLSGDQLIDKVEAVVICRGAEPTGFLEKLTIPIALEHAFEELWQQSSNSLTKLWGKLSTRPDHIKAAARYEDTPVTIMIGGLRFTFPGFSLGIRL
jgi:hypothetical protein